jgi:Na+-transporting methylmalonyl-CoA/oxaloacetate decarboxylase beta subunit
VNRVIWLAVAQGFRRAALPLAWYYAVTLALPLANGAAQAVAAFAEHALVVLVLPPVLIVLVCAAREIARQIRRSRGSARAAAR